MKTAADPFARFLEKQAFVVLDGAMATELESLGADLNDPLWSAKVLIESPGLIEKVHRSYLAAGADILTTASYQATFAGLAGRQLDQREATTLFRRSVRLAADARAAFWEEERDRKGRQYPLIAASIGPYGAFLADGSEYRGNYGLSLAELQDWHRPQVLALAGLPELDFLLFETIPSLLEGQAIAGLMEKAFPEIPYALSFSCKDGQHLSHGESLGEAITGLAAAPGLVAIGINCTAPRFILPLLKTVESRSSPKPLMVYPNSGEVWDAEKHCWLRPEALPEHAVEAISWYEHGARIIGGCCRTTPDQISRIRQAMLSVKSL